MGAGKVVYYTLCAILLTLVIAQHFPSPLTGPLKALDVITTLADCLGLATTALAIWRHATIKAQGSEATSCYLDLLWVLLIAPVCHALNATTKAYDHLDQLALAAFLICTGAFLDLPLVLTAIGSLLTVIPAHIYAEYLTHYRKTQQLLQEQAAPGLHDQCEVDVSWSFCHTRVAFTTAWQPSQHAITPSSFLPRAFMIAAVCIALNFLAQILLNGQRVLARHHHRMQEQEMQQIQQEQQQNALAFETAQGQPLAIRTSDAGQGEVAEFEQSHLNATVLSLNAVDVAAQLTNRSTLSSAPTASSVSFIVGSGSTSAPTRSVADAQADKDNQHLFDSRSSEFMLGSGDAPAELPNTPTAMLRPPNAFQPSTNTTAAVLSATQPVQMHTTVLENGKGFVRNVLGLPWKVFNALQSFKDWLFKPLPEWENVRNLEVYFYSGKLAMSTTKYLAPMFCIPIVIYTLAQAALGLVYSTKWAEAGHPLVFSPSWILLSGICVAVLARLDFVAILKSFSEEQRHSQEIEASLASLRCTHAALLEERRALQAELANYKPCTVVDAGTPASKLMTLISQVLAGEKLPEPDELQNLYNLLLRGADVYQPQDLAAKLVASAADTDVALSLAVTLGQASGHNLETRQKFEDARSNSVTSTDAISQQGLSRNTSTAGAGLLGSPSRMSANLADMQNDPFQTAKRAALNALGGSQAFGSADSAGALADDAAAGNSESTMQTASSRMTGSRAVLQESGSGNTSSGLAIAPSADTWRDSLLDWDVTGPCMSAVLLRIITSTIPNRNPSKTGSQTSNNSHIFSRLHGPLRNSSGGVPADSPFVRLTLSSSFGAKGGSHNHMQPFSLSGKTEREHTPSRLSASGLARDSAPSSDSGHLPVLKQGATGPNSDATAETGDKAASAAAGQPAALKQPPDLVVGSPATAASDALVQSLELCDKAGVKNPGRSQSGTKTKVTPPVIPASHAASVPNPASTASDLMTGAVAPSVTQFSCPDALTLPAVELLKRDQSLAAHDVTASVEQLSKREDSAEGSHQQLANTARKLKHPQLHEVAAAPAGSHEVARRHSSHQRPPSTAGAQAQGLASMPEETVLLATPPSITERQQMPSFSDSKEGSETRSAEDDVFLRLSSGIADSVEFRTNSGSNAQQQAHGLQELRMPSFAMLDQVETLLAKVDDWGYNIFTLDEATQGHALSTLAFFLITRAGLIQEFSINSWTLARYLYQVESGYLPNPYHNKVHVAHVLHRLHMVIHRGGFMPHYVDSIGLLACYLAATVHDYEHLGTTNDYLISTQDPLAILYNDKAPLENHHLAASWALMTQPAFNFLSHLPRQFITQLRKLMIELVLGTDMKMHFNLLSQFTALQTTAEASKRTKAGGKAGPSRMSSGRPSATKPGASVPLPPASSISSQPSAVQSHHSAATSTVTALAPAGPPGRAPLPMSNFPSHLSASAVRQQLRPQGLRHLRRGMSDLHDTRSLDLPRIAAGVDALPEQPERSSCSATVLEMGPSMTSPRNSGTNIAEGVVPAGRSASYGAQRPDSPLAVSPPALLSVRTSVSSINSPHQSSDHNIVALQPMDEQDRVLSLQIALKAADLCNLCDPHDTHIRWVDMLEEEFFRQGDMERELGLPISPLFDRNKPGVSKSQVSFMDIVAVPLFKQLAMAFPGTEPLLSALMSNHAYWVVEKEKAEKEKAEKEKAEAQA